MLTLQQSMCVPHIRKDTIKTYAYENGKAERPTVSTVNQTRRQQKPYHGIFYSTQSYTYARNVACVISTFGTSAAEDNIRKTSEMLLLLVLRSRVLRLGLLEIAIIIPCGQFVPYRVSVLN